MRKDNIGEPKVITTQSVYEINGFPPAHLHGKEIMQWCAANGYQEVSHKELREICHALGLTCL